MVHKYNVYDYCLSWSEMALKNHTRNEFLYVDTHDIPEN
jgi:hypothetical protein